MSRRRILGNLGERLAAAHLERAGMAVLARQWRAPGGELDLVLRDGAELVFVEVRTRRGGSPGLAAESVGPAKRARLAALAAAYLEAHAIPPDTPWRIDVVTVALDAAGRLTGIEHIPHAVEQT